MIGAAARPRKQQQTTGGIKQDTSSLQQIAYTTRSVTVRTSYIGMSRRHQHTEAPLDVAGTRLLAGVEAHYIHSPDSGGIEPA